jgi:hypothetical protein
MGRSVFPDDAIARIYKPSRAATTSGTARTRGWRLVFERRTAPFIEPLMGYTSGRDTLTQVEMEFPTLESAVHYAERQGLTPACVFYTPMARPAEKADQQEWEPSRVFSDATFDRLGLAGFQESYRHALDGAANRNDPSGPRSWPSSMGRCP